MRRQQEAQGKQEEQQATTRRNNNRRQEEAGGKHKGTKGNKREAQGQEDDKTKKTDTRGNAEANLKHIYLLGLIVLVYPKGTKIHF